ncbi:MAG: hypothetical protein R3B48_30025 [Kofleriaceae bacterium]
MASSSRGSRLWIAAWTRAVAAAAWRRTAAVWTAVAVLAGVVMGPTGLLPADVVALLVGSTAAACLLGGLWLALLHPTARTLARGEEARYLRCLAAPRVAPALPWLTLAAMHAPPLALFAAAGRWRLGAAVWLGLTAASFALAKVELPRRAPRPLAWRAPGQALRAVITGRLLADDGLLRGVAFAALAGLGAGLMIRNNQLLGASASTLGLGTIIVLGTPAWAAVTQPAARAHHRVAAVCFTAGMPAGTWLASLALVLAATLAVLFGLAAALAALFGGLPAGDLLRLVGGGLALGAAAGAAEAAVARWATRSAQVAARILTGTLLIAAAWALLLGLVGEAALLAAPALAVAALTRAPEPTWA